MQEPHLGAKTHKAPWLTGSLRECGDSVGVCAGRRSLSLGWGHCLTPWASGLCRAAMGRARVPESVAASSEAGAGLAVS